VLGGGVAGGGPLAPRVVTGMITVTGRRPVGLGTVSSVGGVWRVRLAAASAVITVERRELHDARRRERLVRREARHRRQHRHEELHTRGGRGQGDGRCEATRVAGAGMGMVGLRGGTHRRE
jgi:hypothetical protein